MSGKDIAAEARWLAEISDELETTNFGIVCVTRDNQDAPWLSFEAGSLAKAVGSSRVVPLAIDLKVSDVRLPLGQFQAQPRSREGILEVLKSLTASCTRPLAAEKLLEACDVWWPRLAPDLDAIEQVDALVRSDPIRSDRELLEEILTTMRGLLQTRRPAWLAPTGDQLAVLAAWIREQVQNVDDISYFDGSLHVTTGTEPSVPTMDRIETAAKGVRNRRCRFPEVATPRGLSPRFATWQC